MELLKEELLKEILLVENDVKLITKQALSTLRNDRSRKRGIPYIRLGRSVRYRLADVQEYIQAHRIQTERKGRGDKAA